MKVYITILISVLFLSLCGCNNRQNMNIDNRYEKIIGEWRSADDSIGYTQAAYSVDLIFNSDGTGRIINTKYWNSKKREIKIFYITFELKKNVILSNGDEAVEINLLYEKLEFHDGDKPMKEIRFNNSEGAFTIIHFEDENTLFMPSRDSSEGDSKLNRISSIDKKRSLIKYSRLK